MTYDYRCPECDNELSLPDPIPGDARCGCGKTMVLLKPDLFEPTEYLEKCAMCINKNAELCNDCRHQ